MLYVLYCVYIYIYIIYMYLKCSTKYILYIQILYCVSFQRKNLEIIQFRENKRRGWNCQNKDLIRRERLIKKLVEEMIYSSMEIWQKTDQLSRLTPELEFAQLGLIDLVVGNVGASHSHQTRRAIERAASRHFSFLEELVRSFDSDKTCIGEIWASDPENTIIEILHWDWDLLCAGWKEPKVLYFLGSSIS